jgi:hypothetical protein
MTWVRLDEQFAKHPKVVKAGPLGMAMQVAALCYCNTYLTDGFVPRAVVAGLLDFEGLGMRMWMGEFAGGGEDATWQLVVEDLLDAGLWTEEKGGYRIHDYLDYQPSKEAALKLREDRSAAGQKGGKASAEAKRQASASASAEPSASANVAANAQAKSNPVPDPVPVTEPQEVHSPPEEGSGEEPSHGVGTQAADTAPPPKPLRGTIENDTERLARQLCDLLADEIETWAGERPVVRKTWRTAARLLITKDGYTPEQVEALIRWVTSSEFWRPNILSMPKLREKRLMLIGQIQRARNGTGRSVAHDQARLDSLNELLGGTG